MTNLDYAGSSFEASSVDGGRPNTRGKAVTTAALATKFCSSSKSTAEQKKIGGASLTSRKRTHDIEENSGKMTRLESLPQPIVSPPPTAAPQLPACSAMDFAPYAINDQEHITDSRGDDGDGGFGSLLASSMAACGQFTTELHEARRDSAHAAYAVMETTSSTSTAQNMDDPQQPSTFQNCPQTSTSQNCQPVGRLPQELANSPLLDTERSKPLSKLEVIYELQNLRKCAEVMKFFQFFDYCNYTYTSRARTPVPSNGVPDDGTPGHNPEEVHPNDDQGCSDRSAQKCPLVRVSTSAIGIGNKLDFVSSVIRRSL